MATPPSPLRDLDWEPARAADLGAAAVELWRDWLTDLPKLPVDRGFRREDVVEHLAFEVPEEPIGDDAVMRRLRELVFDLSMYPGHPGFLAYISGAGTIPGAVADFVAAAVNQNVGGWRLSPGATEVEVALMGWFANLFGLPSTGGGLMVSGGAMANFVAIKAARDARAGFDVGARGVAAGPPLALYATNETHVVTERAADMIGIGKDAVRHVPLDDHGRMRVDLLEDAVVRDKGAGVHPFCVVATAGTTGIGAIDALGDIADVCDRHGMWFHVDAAYGGAAILSPELKGLLAGIERADSIAFDPHKWMYIPQSAGSVLVRDLADLNRSFCANPPYVYQHENSGRGGDLRLLGPQFSRGWLALKVWVSLLAHGKGAFGRRIAHDVALTRYLADLVDEHPELERLAPVTLSICCFRYVPPGLDEVGDRDGYLDELNRRIMTEVQADGRVYYSNAVIAGRFALRTCIVNFRTEAPDMDRVVEVTLEIGRRMDAELRPGFAIVGR